VPPGSDLLLSERHTTFSPRSLLVFYEEKRSRPPLRALAPLGAGRRSSSYPLSCFSPPGLLGPIPLFFAQEFYGTVFSFPHGRGCLLFFPSQRFPPLTVFFLRNPHASAPLFFFFFNAGFFFFFSSRQRGGACVVALPPAVGKAGGPSFPKEIIQGRFPLFFPRDTPDSPRLWTSPFFPFKGVFVLKRQGCPSPGNTAALSFPPPWATR